VPKVVLGLDIGGANLKAATATKQAASASFALWKNPDGLADALRSLLAKFPEADEFAVTMTGELCDCFETKRAGVAHILKHVRVVSRSHPVRVWSTAGRFLDCEQAAADPMAVASANWHALATLAGQWCPRGVGLLIDIGSTTTDIIPLLDGQPATRGKIDPTRLREGELLYTGVRRTPIMAVLPPGSVAAELFATMHDAYLLTGDIAEDAADTDTADGRPATKAFAHARLSRMLCGDPEVTTAEDTLGLAQEAKAAQEALVRLVASVQLDRGRGDRRDSLNPTCQTYVTSGSGEFLALSASESLMKPSDVHVSLTGQFGPELAACAPAYAVAVLATERPS
jgi:probable H4MPT-linked C1 transfer pathway protein